MTRFLAVAACLAALAHLYAYSQAPCSGSPLTGTVRDSALALIPGATLVLDGNQRQTSDSAGQFRFPCVARGPHHIATSALGFANHNISVTAPHPAALDLVLDLAAVQTDIDVSASDPAAATSPTAAGPTASISGNRLQSLADDPDDLLLELQQMAAAAGGSPGSATVAVDGFDSGEGTTHLPPKSSIAFIKINPDLFSAEYREPPFSGGRIEVYTKPGQSTFHGALFATNSSSWMNARDPFSTGSSPLGKQRYGFELTGPVRKQGADFFASLEHRSIANDAVVNAVTVNAAGVQSPILQTVSAPQQLWIGNAKTDWQLGPKNTFIVSLDTFNNDLKNVGVGGVYLAENGYEASSYDTNIHITDVTTVSPKIMHEARFGLELEGFANTPNSAAPQVQVAGAFTSGGGSQGNSYEAERWFTIIDDAIIQTKSHLIKVGIQPEFILISQHFPTNFNGTYVFGGGVTSTGAPLTGIQQYVNALNGAPNGAPTTFSSVAGSPNVAVFGFRNAIYYQDDWKVAERLHFAYGLRYYTQINPTIVSALTPRFGVAWSPDKKSTWTLHAHAGMFSGQITAHNWGQILFSDGTQRVSNTVYSPSCPGKFDPSTCTPLATRTLTPSVQSIRAVAPNFSNTSYAIENVGFSKTFPKGFTLSGDYYIAQLWHSTRTENINAPTNGSPTGPRPFGPNLNILQMQGSGRGYANVQSMGISQQSLKRVQFFAGAVRVIVIDDSDNNPFFTPQTTGINTGEYARRDNQGLWQIFGNASVNLPAKVALSANYNGTGLQAYNVTTGFDNNGDGDFNDRPQYATPGTPLCSINPNASPCGYATPWGELVTSGGVGSLSRDKGNMPWTFHLDTNIQRTFTLTHNLKAEHQQTLTLNLRSSNVLNRLNVTSVGTVLGSPLFGIPYAADNGRRIKAGLRYSF